MLRKRPYLNFFAAAATAMSLCCAARVLAEELYDFQPPSGWHDLTHTNLSDRAVAVWRGPTDSRFGENILILVKPGAQSLEQATDEKALLGQWPQARISKRMMTVCGGHPAMYVYVVAPWHDNTLISENVISVWGNVAYSATYSHLSDQVTVTEARAALVTLCPSSASHNSATTW